MDVQFFATAAEFRGWLELHHATADELWLGLYKKSSGLPSITWPESVEEALCFGWIDGIRKSIDEVSYRIRFTPRRSGSIWSTVNIQKAQELIEEGRMRPAGLEAFSRRKEDRARQYTFEQGVVSLGDEFQAEFRANATAWEFFQSQAPSYQKAVSWWVVSAKREETRRRRLAKLIRESEKGKRILG